MLILRFSIVCLSCLLTACVLIKSSESIDDVAVKTNFQLKIWRVDGFAITTYSKVRRPAQPIHIYIEGDGHAWVTRSQASADPTPHKPLVLQLAALDQAENVMYIARPCQYSLASSPACNEHYWTDQRYSKEVISAMSAVLDSIKHHYQAPNFELTGYSGGGALAVLLAAQRDDVVGLRTIAGNLDHVAVSKYHQVSLMPNSLNPIDFTAQVQHIPQLHFVAEHDKIVQPGIAEHFVAKVGTCARVKRVQAATHDEGWLEVWPLLQAEPLSCR